MAWENQKRVRVADRRVPMDALCERAGIKNKSYVACEVVMAGKQQDRLALRIRLLGEVAAEGRFAILAMVVIVVGLIAARAMRWI